jgi:uroporphyrin-III C-methyltransferase/precorrin-2 dehydrogenase/sirohydrochlorin ferrochelatase
LLHKSEIRPDSIRTSDVRGAKLQGDRQNRAPGACPTKPRRSRVSPGSAIGRGRTGGFVSLVGAGPGDPDLLTLAAARRLRQADLVLFDALVSAATLRLARRAQRFCVGKRAGRPSASQETINRLMIRGARRGQRVVRLKGGDPFVLGRGGEEALALAAAGVPFEVLPGVTAAVAAPGLAGIPVTHRGVSSAFVVVSGHAAEAYEPVLASLAAGTATVVMLMGVASRADVARTLLDNKWSETTGAGIVFGAATPEQTTWWGTLGELADAPADTATGSPGTIVVGDVVNVAHRVAALIAPACRGVAMLASAGLSPSRAPARRAAPEGVSHVGY